LGFFDFLKPNKKKHQVQGSLSYIPGSQLPTQETPISFEGGELVKRMYIQPEFKVKEDHTSIAIYTDNPFRHLVNTSISNLQ
jgi:hypothetical protein